MPKCDKLLEIKFFRSRSFIYFYAIVIFLIVSKQVTEKKQNPCDCLHFVGCGEGEAAEPHPALRYSCAGCTSPTWTAGPRG